MGPTKNGTEMPDLPLYFSTVVAWLLLSGMAWRASRVTVVADGPAVRRDLNVESFLYPVALVLHAMLLYRRVMTAEGLDLGVGIQERQAHLAQHLLDVVLGDARMAAQGLDDVGQALREGVEHGE